MAPLRNARLAALGGVGMLAAASATFPCAGAHAQIVAPSYTDPLSAKLQTSARNSPRFEKFDSEKLAQLAAPASFSPPAAGAGVNRFRFDQQPEGQIKDEGQGFRQRTRDCARRGRARPGIGLR